MLDLTPGFAVRLIGYCNLSEDQILRRFQQEGADALRALEGEYTIVVTTPDECWIMTSPVGATHYFYHHQGEHFHHGQQVAIIASQAGLDWRWNWQALGDLLQLENLTGNATLHPEIHKVPPGSLVHFHNPSGRLRLESRICLDELPRRHSTPAEAVECLNRSVETWAGANPYLSLSGGFDSRVILASMLRCGIRPHLVTVGSETSSDVQVARRIATHFNLRHNLIQLELDDLLDHGLAVSALTNGTKTASHWHTFVYPLKASIPSGAAFFVGTLGELARNYYFDYGSLGLLADRFPTFSLNQFWSLKLSRHPTFLEGELEGLAPELSRELDSGGIQRRARRLSGFCHHRFLQGLTRYYFEQRVPNFYANGIAMYRSSSAWRSPFHSRAWIEAVWNLPERWKLGSNWHRFAIARNCPDLLDFSEEKGFDRRRMLRRAPPLYWTPLIQRATYVTYDQSATWYRQPLLQDFLRDHFPLIDDLVDPALAARIADSHCSGMDRTRTLAHLLTLIRWRQVLSEAAL
ncbi:asparagine synthase-related protein [Cyanobium sp. FGCU-6]|nr:asparagine synthase-related protein [Cyanobium sp. FGCU6]